MAQNAITAANGALAANSVVDPKIVSVGINKVTYGVSVFAGDVVLSRGVGLPVIVLQNTGIFLYGQSNPSDGATGLTSHPYVAIQNNGIGLFQGGTLGGSIFLDATSNAITIYSENGQTGFPYLTVNSGGLAMVNGPNSLNINTNAMSIVDTQFHNRLDLSSAGITLANSSTNNKLVITASQIQLQMNNQSRITLDASAGITISNGGTSSVVITANSATITNGIFSFNTGTVSVNIGPAVASPEGSIAGIMVNTSTAFAVLSSGSATFSGTLGVSGSYSQLGQLGLVIADGGPNQTALSSTFFQMTGLPSSNPGAGSKRFWYDPADGDRVKFAA
jgi:hypothetical protein